MSELVRLRSRRQSSRRSGVLVTLTRQRAGWQFVRFAVRQIAGGDTWTDRTGRDELCLVLLSGECRVRWTPGGSDAQRIGPRKSVFDGYPHALYLPPGTRFAVEADDATEIAECRAASARMFPARIVRPEDCGCEIRGGGNASRQIVDILPPAFPAGRLLICEVYTPGGNWSSYPPHKHDRDNPPSEVDLEEIYYYRFRDADAFGMQRLYSGDGRRDRALTVRDGDLVIVRDGYHPFVTAFGYDAYYLNVLAGTRRSMAASDDPRYAAFRHRWPPPDPRLPLVSRSQEPGAK
jgi:5-deoxy-glucuronate isomerase